MFPTPRPASGGVRLPFPPPTSIAARFMNSWDQINTRNPYVFYHATGGQGWVDGTVKDRRGATLVYLPPITGRHLTYVVPSTLRKPAWMVNWVQADPWKSTERQFARFEDAYQKFEEVCNEWELAW